MINRVILIMKEMLQKIFTFVRAGLYTANGKICFGELTFMPESGIVKIETVLEPVRLTNLIDFNR